MPVIVTTTPEDVAVDLGRDFAGMSSLDVAQIQRWIDDAAFLISQAVEGTPDPEALDYVIRQAVVAVAQAPTPGIVSESVQVDDGMLSQRFERTPRRVAILPEWWAMLGVDVGKGQAFTIDMIPPGYAPAHIPWCDLNMGGAGCSCGASLTLGSPLWEC